MKNPNGGASTSETGGLNVAEMLSYLVPNVVIAANDEVQFGPKYDILLFPETGFFQLPYGASWLYFRNGKAFGARTHVIGTSNFGIGGLKSEKN